MSRVLVRNAGGGYDLLATGNRRRQVGKTVQRLMLWIQRLIPGNSASVCESRTQTDIWLMSRALRLRTKRSVRDTRQVPGTQLANVR